MWEEKGRRSDKGIICDGASSPPTDSARSPTMSTWGSGRDIDGGGRVWPHQRPVPRVGDGLGGYYQHNGIEGSHPPGKVRGGRRTARPLPRERIVRTDLPSGPYSRPGWIGHGPLTAARKGPFLLDEDTRPVENLYCAPLLPWITAPRRRNLRKAQRKVWLPHKNIMITDETYSGEPAG